MEDSSSITARLAQAGLQDSILMPDSEDYKSRIASYWCNSAKLHPACLLQPSSASQVAMAIKTLANENVPFAVRAGGHMNWAGSNNIDGGVTIDLARLSQTTYDSASDTADIGPAAKWKDVYAVLEPHGRTVAGARESEVGVGGFLLGGGNNLYAAHYGFSCDSVVAYEVVLADGSIVTALRKGEYADLFRVLKGGGNNFGIVTRFTMCTIPFSGQVWGGIALHPLDTTEAAAQALVNFNTNMAQDPDTNMQMVVTFAPRLGGQAVLSICANTAGVENPPALKETLALPQNFNNCKTMPLQEFLSYSSLPTDYYNIWYTLSFRNDLAIILKASELHNQLAKDIKSTFFADATTESPPNFSSHIAFQPIPRLYAARSKATNPRGNVLGMNTQLPHDAILIQAAVSVRTAELEAWARPRLSALIDALREFAAAQKDADGVGGAFDWTYMNYASPEQKVLEGYGSENLELMRMAARKYDAHGVFQKLCPGGFKISRVREE